ncbi:phage tail protein [Massilia oculi]|jgi:microcystin-dependent protein|uniref:phage tail protein n=1 Tax=Massilia oculi TaxID=945844 RepID=UPI001AAF363A|nr:tail fiber protein [Massilia oculi]
MADNFLGEIRMFAGAYAPQGWELCNGQILPISGNEGLYSLIGTTYGGDGRTTFALPDLRGRVPVHKGAMQDGTNFVIGQSAGTETVTLMTSQMPLHTHTVNAQSTAGNSTAPKNLVWAGTEVTAYSDTQNKTLKAMNAQAIGIAGGSQPHENMMPFITVSFIIAMNGEYPSSQ